jgi:hypothetical protein
MSMQQETKRYWMPSHVCGCPTLTGAVLLDLKRNRYFGVGRKEADVLHMLAGNWPTDAEHDAPQSLTSNAAVRIAEELVEAGLLSRDVPTPDGLMHGQVTLTGTLASVGHELDRSAPIQFGHIVAFLRSCAWAGRALRSRTLYSIACEIARDKAFRTDWFDEQRTIELVGIFRRLRPHAFAATNRCLFHALALMNFLSRYEVFPTWVIGVRAKPWAAHSWVQHDNLILDSNPEHICEYTPLLAI